MKKSLLLTSLICVFALSACNTMEKQNGEPAPIYSENIKSLEATNWLTGALASPSTIEIGKVGGTDLGIPCYDATNNRMLFAFGDTYSGSYLDDAVRSGDWRSNVIGYMSNFNLKKGIKLDGFIAKDNDPNHAKQIVSRLGSDQIEVTNIPTGMIFVGENLYLFHMSVRHWGTGGEWYCNYGGCVKSTDYGQNWSRVKDLTWTDSNSANVQFVTDLTKEEATNRIAPNFMQIFPVDGKDGYIYLYGIPGGRLGGVKLMRVLPTNFETFLEYEYYVGLNSDGTPKFVKGNEGRTLALSDDAYIIAPQVGEVSVMYNSYLQKWIMIANCGNRHIYIRYSPTPWGEWSDAKLLVTLNEFPLCYCGWMHEKLTEKDGKIIYFMMSLYEEYNVRVMKLEFE